METYIKISMLVIIFLTFIQLILPTNSMKNVSKSVISLICVFTLAVPLINLIKNKELNSEITFDKKYYEHLNVLENNTIINESKLILKQYHLEDYEIEIIENSLSEKSVEIIFHNAEYGKNEEHINSIETCKKEILEKCLGTLKEVVIKFG